MSLCYGLFSGGVLKLPLSHFSDIYSASQLHEPLNKLPGITSMLCSYGGMVVISAKINWSFYGCSVNAVKCVCVCGCKI